MRIIFFGTGKFGIPTLEKIAGSGHELAAVVTQPDRKRGRGHNVMPTPIKSASGKIAPGVDVLQPEKASTAGFIGLLEQYAADVFVVVDYGQILSAELLEVPSKFCINLHPSLLPKYRGAAPVNHTVLNGEEKTGNTVFRMNERMDAGDILAQSAESIGPDENAGELLHRMSVSGADLVLEVLDKISEGKDQPVPQDETRATFARKLKKEDGRIDWSDNAENIINKVKAFQPWPGAYTYLDGKLLRIIKASGVPAPENRSSPGEIAAGGDLTVRCGEGAVKLETVQLEGKKAMPAEEFMKGYRIEEKAMLG